MSGESDPPAVTGGSAEAAETSASPTAEGHDETQRWKTRCEELERSLKSVLSELRFLRAQLEEANRRAAEAAPRDPRLPAPEPPDPQRGDAG